VKPGRRHGDLRQVDEGLEPEDLVIVNGMQRARPGATVDPKRSPIRGQTAGTEKAVGAGPGEGTPQPSAAKPEPTPPSPGEKASR
jgi:membrane fusion protein (multidrug efflux system)